MMGGQIKTDRPRLRIKAKPEEIIKVDMGAGEHVDAAVEYVHEELLQLRLPSGKIEAVYPGSERLNPVTSALSNPVQMEVLNSGSERIGRIVQERVPLFKSRPFVEHACGPGCLPPFLPALVRGQNPLLVPLRLGWRREAARTVPSELCLAPKPWRIYYVAPCGRRLRSIEEMETYLEMCKTRLEIDCFTFDPWVNVRDKFVVGPVKAASKDISDGKELNPIPAVNAVDESLPRLTDYCCELMPQGGVNIPRDPKFLVGCSCTDNCTDKKLCLCAQLTIRATAIDVDEQLVLHDAGYDQRRLKDVLITGIYECNSKCACSSTCHNRVQQLPIKVNLQVFKTLKRGWGLRALHDIPQGTFVCKYVGNLYNSEDGNVEGQKHGDDYFCELDLIELVEREKEGYESDVTDIEEEEDQNCAGDEGSKRKLPTESGEEEEGDQRETKKFRSIRSFYPEGVESNTFIIDAMKTGNVGRFLNHSCDPNIFVQNIFQETHDLRFPTVAFFTCKFVKAGEELCWNYNYEVDSVPGRRIDCHCRAEMCKKRLL